MRSSSLELTTTAFRNYRISLRQVPKTMAQAQPPCWRCVCPGGSRVFAALRCICRLSVLTGPVTPQLCIQVARAVAAFGAKFQRTVIFVAFGAEEQGCFGSNEFVRQLALAGKMVVAALTMDMTSYVGSKFGVVVETSR